MNRRWRWLLRITGLVLATTFLVIGVQVYLYGRMWDEFSTRTDHIEAMILDLGKYPPPGASEHHWLNLCQGVVNGEANALFSPSHVSMEEVRRLEADVQRKLEGETQPKLETLEWVWNRMGECGPFQKRYITRMRPLFDEWADAVFPDRVATHAQDERDNAGHSD